MCRISTVVSRLEFGIRQFEATSRYSHHTLFGWTDWRKLWNNSKVCFCEAEEGECVEDRWFLLSMYRLRVCALLFRITSLFSLVPPRNVGIVPYNETWPLLSHPSIFTIYYHPTQLKVKIKKNDGRKIIR